MYTVSNNQDKLLEILQYLPKLYADPSMRNTVPPPRSNKMSCDPHLDDRVERLEKALENLGIVLPAFPRPPKPVAPHNIIIPDLDKEWLNFANKLFVGGALLSIISGIVYLLIANIYIQDLSLATGVVGFISMIFGGLGRPPRRKRRL